MNFVHTAVTVHAVGHISDVIFFSPDIILQVQFGQQCSETHRLIVQGRIFLHDNYADMLPQILKQTFVMSVC